MSGVERFEDLCIWQEARELVRHVYCLCGPESPSYRDFTFRDQLRSAAISIMNNIAEGFERRSDQEFARFLDIAKGSGGEVRSMLYAAEDLEYATSIRAEQLRHEARELSKGTAALAAHLRK